LKEQLLQLFLAILQLIAVLLHPIISIPTIFLIWRNKKYKESAYYQITKQPLRVIVRDSGKYGEYLTYRSLKTFEKKGARFLFNLYIPKGIDETTEIDILMICGKGIFVFESKNYSGWIFGSENQKTWYQTLPAGKGKSHKEKFYNPIMQNNSHIKHLKSILDKDIPIQSIIVFSNRCELKQLQITSKDISVVQRKNVENVVTATCGRINIELSEEELEKLYKKLYPYTQTDAATKTQHILNIRGGEMCTLDQEDTTPAEEGVLFQKTDLYLSKSADELKEEETAAEDNSLQLAEKKKIHADNRINDNQISLCPKCHGNLVLRIATRGVNAGNQFYGCSNYPKCRYIRNIIPSGKTQ